MTYVIQHLPVVKHEGYVNPSLRHDPQGQVGSARIATRLMFAICDHFDRVGQGLTITTLEQHYKISLATLVSIIQRLEQAGYIVETSAEESCFVPARPLDQIYVQHIVLLFEGGDLPNLRQKDALSHLFSHLDELQNTALSTQNFYQLILQERQNRHSA